eukprot:2735065-Amphidinium_carterae.1
MQARLDLYLAVCRNPRMKAFTNLPGHPAKPFPPPKQEAIKRHYRRLCAFCGFDEDGGFRKRGKCTPKILSVAHIASNNAGFDTTEAGRRFKERF